MAITERREYLPKSLDMSQTIVWHQNEFQHVIWNKNISWSLGVLVYNLHYKIYYLRFNLWAIFANNFKKISKWYLKQFCDIFVSSICIWNWKKHVDALNACSLETFCALGYIYDLRMFLQHLLQIPKRLFVALFYTKLLLARYYALGKFWYTDSHACIAFLFFQNSAN